MLANIKTRIEAIVNNLEQLPAIPEVASKVISMVNDPDVSFKKVAEEISKNQSMTTNILKLCNSAYFGKGKEVTSIERAITILGLKEVKDIIMLVVAKPVLEKQVIGYDLAQGALWEQGLLVANLSKSISEMIKRKDISDVVFTGGIIHNVGKVVLALFVQSAFNEILDTVQTKDIPFDIAEKEVMGFNHQEVGERILTKWNFPPVLKAIVRYYQEPEISPKEFMMEVSIVHIANALSIMAGVGVGSDGLYHSIKSEAITVVGISNHDLEKLFAQIPEKLKEMRVLKL